MDSATPQHTNTAAGGGHAVAEIARALSAESWARKDVGTPKAVFTARTWTSPDGSLQLLLTSGGDGLHADLTGATTSGDGLAPPRLWSLTVTTPSPAQITAVVKAGCHDAPGNGRERPGGGPGRRRLGQLQHL